MIWEDLIGVWLPYLFFMSLQANKWRGKKGLELLIKV